MVQVPISHQTRGILAQPIHVAISTELLRATSSVEIGSMIGDGSQVSSARIQRESKGEAGPAWLVDMHVSHMNTEMHADRPQDGTVAQATPL